MDRKTYLELEELNKKIWYANKSVDTIKEVCEKTKTDLEATNSIVVDSAEKISQNSENISKASSEIETNIAAIDLLTTNISNANLLINGDFTINQRGKTTYTGTGYTVDRWKNSNSYCLTTIIDGGISFSANGGTAYIYQDVENAFNLYKGKTLTFSVKINGVIYVASGTVPTTLGTSTVRVCKTLNITGGSAINLWLRTDGMLRAQVGVLDGYTFDIEYIKVEFGAIATPFYPRPYAEELLLCQRYYEKGAPGSIVKLAYSSNLMYDQQVVFKVQKRTTPTVACYSNSNTKNALTNSSTSNNVTVTYTNISSYGFRVYSSAGGFSKDHIVVGYYEADAEI